MYGHLCHSVQLDPLLIILMDHLYNTLFDNSDQQNQDDNDITMQIINQMYGPMDFNCLSKYYDLIAYNNLISTVENNLNFLHVNSRSLQKNFDNIIAFMNSLSAFPDILTISETWLTTTNKHLYELPGYHCYHLTRTIRPHGGVSVYISNSLKSQQIQECTLINDDIEIITVKIHTASNIYNLCSIYRPHSKHIGVEEFNDILCNILQNDCIKNNNIIIMGDLNINLLEHDTHAPTNNFLASLQALNFYPHISRPTRFPDNINLGQPSLLDHIFTNFNNNFTAGIIHIPVSDHLPVFLNIPNITIPNKLHKIEFRNLSHSNKEKFTSKLNLIDWNALLSSNDVNCNFKYFLRKIQEIFDESFPLQSKFITEKRLHNPWITQTIINSIKRKNSMYKDYKIGAISESEFKKYRNTLNCIIKQAKVTFYLNIFTNFKSNTRKIWNTINNLSKKNNKIFITDYISQNNTKLTNPTEITEAFNQFYINIAPNLDQTLPPSNTDPLNFLRGNYLSSMTVPPIDPQIVIDIINSLKNKKSNPHEIPVSILKGNKDEMALPLSILFNQSINTGKFPQCLKHATVIPIYKKGAKDNIGNYRPISLLSVFSKIFEKLMKKYLNNYLETKNILNSKQFGFRQGLNTFDALNTFNEEIYSSLDSQSSLLSIYVDFTKAFDTVRHDILLKKLNHYGIRGTIHDWFRDYLSHRTQSTKFLNSLSTPRPIHYGVPQGSVLGPILFLLYINDITHIFTNLKTILFADDSTLYITGDDPTTLIHTANDDLNIFYKWCTSNRLTVNLKKTFYMLFTNKQINILPSLYYHDKIIHRTNQHNLLGIKYDDNMTFKFHISNLILKLSRIVSLLYQVKDFVPHYVLTILYNAHVLPHFQYCIPIWCNTYPTHLLPLLRLQKKIIRIITKSDYFAHTQSLFKETNILKLFDINKIQTGIFMYKLINIGNTSTLRQQHNYPTRTRGNLRTPIHHLTIFQHSLSFTGPKTWNSIPEHIKSLPTLSSFKKQYKKHIISQY